MKTEMVNFVKGYNGQILYVDLTKEKTWIGELDEATARKYIGGAGLCAKIIWDGPGRILHKHEADSSWAPCPP
jgi:aldehyde:ferredoxin oxidoreductase